ncbi:MAG TPA: hypothetical protein VEB19_15310 [Gemmatimonadaceae bacterium]|nr:hypothetical protein [Gemmatimonadaceae bacterium]
MAEDSKEAIPRPPISRRKFVAAGGGMLLGATLDACTSEGVRAQRGLVRLLVNGLTGDPASGGTARFTHTKGQPVYLIQIPIPADVTFPADIGDYTFSYEAPPGFQVVGQAEPRSTVVDLEATTIIPINVVEQASVGSISVTISGLTGVQGGTAVAQRTDAAASPRVISIGSNGTGTVTGVEVGVYDVSYDPPAGFIDTSAANPVTGVSVSAGGTGSATFSVAVAPGSLHVTVNGIAGAASGGQISAIRTDNTGDTFTLNLPAPTSGQSIGDISSLPAGAYNVSYTAPTGFQLTAGSASTQVVSVSAGGTANVTFAGQRIPGSIQVTVSGLTGATSGGTVTAVNTDTGSSSNRSLPAPVSGSSSGSLADLLPGSYNVSLTPPAGFQLTSASPVFVTVASGAATPAAFTCAVSAAMLRVVVSGVAASAPNAGSIDVLRSDIPGQSPVNFTIPISGSLETTLQPGAYSVDYTPVTGYQLTAGQTDPRNVTLLGGQTAITTFQVTEITAAGTLRLTVTGIDAGAANGGSAQVQRTDVGGQTPLSINVPLSGTVDSPLQPGTYSVTYTAPPGRRLTAGQTNPQSITIASSATGSVAFQIEQVPAAVGIVFHSDWSTAVGTSDAAKRDTSSSTPWGGVRGNSSAVETLATAGLDAAWPTANAFVIRVPAGQSSLGAAWSQPYINLGLPGNGSHRFFRMYTAMLWADSHGHGNTLFGSTVPGSGNVEHGVESADITGTGGGDGFNPMWLCNANGHWMFAWRDINTGQRFNCDTILLNKFATYRVEFHVAYGATTYTVQVRIYDGAGVLVLDDADLVSNGVSLTNATFAYTPAEHQEFRVGCNGPTSNYGDTGTQAGDAFRAHGAVAISDTDWCGPYANGI